MPLDEDEKMAAAIDRVEGHLQSLLITAAKHEKWLESIDRRLEVLNGTVATHTREVGELKVFAAAHPYQCEVGAKVDQLASKIAENRIERKAEVNEVKLALDTAQKVEAAEKKVNAAWWRRVHPLIWAVASIILTVLTILVLQTPDSFRKALTHGG